MKRFIKNIILFTGILLLLCLAFEWVIGNLVKVPQISNHNIYAKAQKLIPQIDEHTILFLGDSRIEWGIKPLVIQDALKDKQLKVINMAVPGSNGLDVMKYLKEHNIAPKMIIAGYSTHFGRYKNHKYDKKRYTIVHKYAEIIKYTLNQNSYIYNTNSIKQYLIKKHPYFKHHEYDKLGGAVVTEYGDYNTRKAEQHTMYNLWHDTFKDSTLNEYQQQVKAYKEYFAQQGTIFTGIYMPVSKPLYLLEQNYEMTEQAKLSYDTLYNYASYVYSIDSNATDSLYFYDDSHLNQNYAPIFSQKVAESIQAKLKQ